MPDKLTEMAVDWLRFIAGDREYFVRILDYGGLMGDPLSLTLPPLPGERRNPVVRPLEYQLCSDDIGALEGIRFRLKLQPAQAKINWLVGALAPVASATRTLSQLSAHSFGQAASNLTEEDVSDILKAFGVASPWTQITELSRRVGVGTLDCQSEFVTIKERRHDSAHALTANVLHPDLAGSLRSALAICIGFDLLLSHAQRLTNDKLGPNKDSRPAMTHTDVQLVFVTPEPGSANRFVVRKEQLPPPAPTLKRSLRRLSDLPSAVTYARGYTATRRSHLVVQDNTSTPCDWVCW